MFISLTAFLRFYYSRLWRNIKLRCRTSSRCASHPSLEL